MKPPRQTIRFFDHIPPSDTAEPSHESVKAEKVSVTTLMELLVNAEWRIYVLEHTIDKLIACVSTNTITDEDLASWREAGFRELQRKYEWATLKKTE